MVAQIHMRIIAVVLFVAAAGLTGCNTESTSTGPGPVGDTFTLDDYSWTGTGDLSYISLIEGDQAVYFHDVSFRTDGDSVIATDQFSHSGLGVITTEMFSYKPNSSGLVFSSYTQDALMHLPQAMSMHGSITGESTVLTCLAPLNSEDVLAGTEDGKIMKYNIWQKTWERFGDLDAPQAIRKIVVGRDDPNYVYASTEFKIWYSTDGGRIWNANKFDYGRVLDFTLHRSNTILVTNGDFFFFSSYPFSSRNYWPFTQMNIYGKVNAIGTSNQGSYTLVYLGTDKGEIRHISINGSMIETYGPLYSSSYGSQIRSFVTGTNSMARSLAITDDGNLIVEYQYPLNWLEPRSYTTCLSAAPTSLPEFILIGTTTGITFTEALSTGAEITNGYGQVPHLVYTGGYHLALTEAGPIVSVDDGLTWAPAEEGLTTQATFTGLNLLPAGSLMVTDTWDAGMVVVLPGGPLYTFSMQGSLAMHLDELYSPDQQHVYRDVLVFEYTLKPMAGSNYGGIAYNWKMYYARGIGLVMIQEYNGTQLLTTSYLDTASLGV